MTIPTTPDRPLARLEEAIECVAWSADGHYLAAGDLDGNVVVLTPSAQPGEGPEVPPATSATAAVPAHKHDGGVLSTAWHPRHPLLATGGADATVVLHDLATESTTWVPAGGRVHDLAWSPAGDLLAIAAGNGVLIVDVQGTHIAAYPFLPGRVHQLSWIDGPAPLAAGAHDAVLWLAPAEPGAPTTRYAVRGAAVVLAADRTRQRLAVGDLAGQLHLSDCSTTDEVRITGWDGITAIAWDDGGDHLAVADDAEVTVWRLAGVHVLDDEPIRLLAHDGPVRALTYRGTTLATAGEDGTVAFWPADRLHDPIIRELPAPVRGLAWHPYQDNLAIGTASGDLHQLVHPTQPDL